MIEYSKIQEVKIQIVSLLNKNEIIQATSILNTLVKQASDWHFHDKIHEISTAYQLLLNAYINNQQDAERIEHFGQLKESIFVLLDLLIDKLDIDSGHNSLYLNKKRLLNARVSTYLPLLSAYQGALATHEMHTAQECVSYFFDCIWTQALADEMQRKELLKVLFQTSIPTCHQATYITAILLALSRQFDAYYCLFLVEQCLHGQKVVALRAYVALCFTVVSWPDRIAHYRHLQAQIEQLCQDKEAIHIIQTIQSLLIHCKETSQIVAKMHDEILPDMIRFKRKIIQDAEDPTKDMHPDWNQYIEDATFEKNLQQINELQSAGADVMMGAFAALKDYPFFQTLMHWFLPFDMQFLHSQHDVNTFAKHYPQIIVFVSLSKQLCNSDKYSFVLSLPHLPTKQVQGMHEQIDIPQEFSEKMQWTSETTRELLNQYLRDLYRFFKLHTHKNEFTDIFELDLQLFQTPLLQACFSDTEALMVIGDLYMHKNFFRDASNVWILLKEQYRDDGRILQKLGFCYQQLHEYTLAIPAYLKAEIWQVDDPWTMRKLAQCFKNTQQYEKALHYYLQYNKYNPDQRPVLIQIAHC